MGRFKVQDVATRLFARFEPVDDCWEWTGYIRGGGYGALRINARFTPAHRAMYELLVGDIPEGKFLDHLCENRKCINPSHLEPVTCKENLLRSSKTWASINTAKDECVNGHKFTKLNTYYRKDYHARECRTCRSKASARSLIRKRGYSLG
jgi:hypothetical protein